MNTSSFATRFTQEVKETGTGLVNRPKGISAAGVWNIQRRKKSRIQRGFVL